MLRHGTQGRSGWGPGWLALGLVLVGVEGVAAEAPEARPLRLLVSRDTWVSGVGDEAAANLGGSPRLKLKSYQEFSLIDVEVDPAVFRGRTIARATLHLRSQGEPRLRRVTVGTISAEWVEGSAPTYEPQPGSSSFRWRVNPDQPWTSFGGDITQVILGNGGSRWGMGDASDPDPQGWQVIPVDPAVVAARAAGLGYGFVVFDDTGSEWKRDGEMFTPLPFPNRFVASKDMNRASVPYLEVTLGPADGAAPEAPTGARLEPGSLPPGEAVLSWITPRDPGPAGVLGFEVTAGGQPLPRAVVPNAGAAGERVTMHLRGLPDSSRLPIAIAIRAVDAAGNRGPAQSLALTVPRHEPAALPPAPPAVAAAATRAPLPRLGTLEVAVIDELDKPDATGQGLIPPREVGYLATNHLWDAGRRTIRLQAGRNEFVAFQVLVRGDDPRGLRAAVEWEGQGHAPGVDIQVSQVVPVPAGPGGLGDPVVPLPPGGCDQPGACSFLVELFVRHDARPGPARGSLVLGRGGDSLKLPLELAVGNFTLPDVLSFLPEMNCYDLPANEREYYRLGHAHRVVVNRVPYYQNGRLSEGGTPTWDGSSLDWAAWDARFGPLMDGTAFADLPRRGVPIECFYLALHENWPTPMEGSYTTGYWADQAFSPAYWAAFAEATRQMAAHFQEKGWLETRFQGYLNNKNNFKERGWSRGSSPWLLDEPAHFQDFWALRQFARAFHLGVARAGGTARMLFRADISRPEWQRDSLDGLLDYLVVSSAVRQYPQLVMDRRAREGQIVLEYGSANGLDESNAQPAAWCLDAWTLGCDGVVPWQTIGTPESWRTPDRLALFYPPADGRPGPPAPSLRLKAFRRGQQDVEYLTLYARVTGEPRWAVAQRVREALRLRGQRRGTDAGAVEDAGTIAYDRLTPGQLHELRVRIGAELSRRAPGPRRREVDLNTPRRQPLAIDPRALVTPAP